MLTSAKSKKEQLQIPLKKTKTFKNPHTHKVCKKKKKTFFLFSSRRKRERETTNRFAGQKIKKRDATDIKS